MVQNAVEHMFSICWQMEKLDWIPHRENEDRCVESAESLTRYSCPIGLKLPQLQLQLVCKVHHQSKSSSVPQRAAQIMFATSAAARPHTRTRKHNGSHINHTHRAALGGDFCIARMHGELRELASSVDTGLGFRSIPSRFVHFVRFVQFLLLLLSLFNASPNCMQHYFDCAFHSLIERQRSPQLAVQIKINCEIKRKLLLLPDKHVVYAKSYIYRKCLSLSLSLLLCLTACVGAAAAAVL